MRVILASPEAKVWSARKHIPLGLGYLAAVLREESRFDPLAMSPAYDSNAFVSAPGTERYRPREGAVAMLVSDNPAVRGMMGWISGDTSEGEVPAELLGLHIVGCRLCECAGYSRTGCEDIDAGVGEDRRG